MLQQSRTTQRREFESRFNEAPGASSLRDKRRLARDVCAGKSREKHAFGDCARVIADNYDIIPQEREGARGFATRKSRRLVEISARGSGARESALNLHGRESGDSASDRASDLAQVR